jgi:xanthine/uracil permease
MALVKTEMSEKAAETGRDIGSIAAGAVLLMCGLLVALLGLSALLYWVMVWFNASHYHAGWIAPMIVGVLTAVIGWGLVQSGRSRMRRRSPVPEKSIQSIKEDKQWLTNQTTR